MLQIMVRFEVPGFHHWPTATDGRAYLADRHRHLFAIQVTIEVFHDEREVEFHDVLDFARGLFVGHEDGHKIDLGNDAYVGPSGVEFGAMSCERIGQLVLTHVQAKWPFRRMEVEVWEDGEVGARVTSDD